MCLKGAPQKLNFVMTKAASKSYTLIITTSTLAQLLKKFPA